ncbi:MAG: hypothetical protein RQ729_09825 [Wenzhouxiangellaceae bacterium]|nr:hypothetical protein [Wenzhouxiangellaceae bacterium]
MKFFRTFMPAAIALLITLLATPVQAVQVTGAFTGWWAQPEQQNHGLIVSISRLPDGERIGVIYWATFDESGNPSWLLASGAISGRSIEAEVFRFDGITFMQPAADGSAFDEAIGTMTVAFGDCMTGEVSFDTEGLGTGSFPIERITNQPGVACSGGLSDDVMPHDLPQTFRVEMTAGTGFEGARGEITLDLRPGRGEFGVVTDNLPEGLYALRVGGELRGDFEAAAGDTGTVGSMRFRSPRIPGRLLLDFDPRGQSVEVIDETGAVALSATTPEQGRFMGGNGQPPFDLPDDGLTEIEIEFDNAGVFPDASARIRMEAGSGPGNGARAMSLVIELSGVPVGQYPVRMRGRELGMIEVIDDGASTQGTLQFGFPPLAGQQPFNFDPSGAMFEILDATGTLLFSVDFAEQMPGTGMGPGMGGSPGMGGGPGMGGEPGVRTEIVITLEPQREGITGRAEARWEQRPGRSEFSVRLDAVAAGDYALFVGGIERGVIVVAANGRGRIEFEDPASIDDQPLAFDVLGQTVGVRGPDGTEAAFAGTMPE